MAPKPANVDKLVRAALDGIQEVAGDYSSDEVVSASFSMCRQMIVAVLSVNPSARPQLREAVQTLLMECADPTRN